jgi:hypothetical protein
MLKYQLSRKGSPRKVFGSREQKSFLSTSNCLFAEAQGQKSVEKNKFFESFPQISFEKLVQTITAQHIIQGRPKRVFSMPENTIVFEALKEMHSKDIGCMIVDRYSGGFR